MSKIKFSNKIEGLQYTSDGLAICCLCTYVKPLRVMYDERA